MNIKFGMSNFYTRYLKRFLNSEFMQSSTILGKFEKEDLQNLIKYLNLPNTETIFDVYKGITEEFPQFKELFNMNLEDDMIYFISKKITTATAEFLQDEMEAIEDYCASVGWKVSGVASWVDLNMDINGDECVDELDREILSDIVNNGTIYSEEIMRKADINLDGYRNQEDLDILNEYMETHKLYLILASEGRHNIFPNEDMKVFVNQFTGDFLYNFAIRDIYNSGPDDVVHPENSGEYKIGLFKCKPRSKAYHNT